MSQFKLEVVADTFEELKEKVAGLAISMGFGGFSEEAAPAKKPRKKAETEKAPEPAALAKLADIGSTIPHTLEGASSLVKKVNDMKGLPAAREVLAFVGAARMSEVPEAKFGDVIAKCLEVLNA